MPKVTTHLEAFQSDDGKRGRIWRADVHEYRRNEYDDLEWRAVDGRLWSECRFQVAAMEGTVTWADEPKTLTPQEALRALADGKCIQASGGPMRLYDGRFENFDGSEWAGCKMFGISNNWRIVPDPSQSAEPQVEYPLSYEEVLVHLMDGVEVERESMPGESFSFVDGVLKMRGLRGEKSYTMSGLDFAVGKCKSAKSAKWRIVDGGE